MVEEKTVRVILSNGNNTVVTLSEAKKMADEAGLDLIYISDENESCPVVKIADYNKYLYDEKKKESEQRKKQHKNETSSKEVKLNCITAKHDLEIKASQIDKMLQKNCRITIVVRYKSRTIKLIKDGKEFMDNFLALLTEGYRVDVPYSSNINMTTITIAPDRKKGVRNENK